MAWVKSEYAGELAVLSTWLVALAPWSVSVFSVSGFTIVGLRFLPFRVQYIFGATLENEIPFLWAWEVASVQPSSALTLAGQLGFAAFVLFFVPFGLSVYYYFEEERIAELLPVDPVKLFGGLLGLVGLCSLVAAALFIRFFPGITIPVGPVIALLFAYILLTIDRK